MRILFGFFLGLTVSAAILLSAVLPERRASSQPRSAGHVPVALYAPPSTVFPNPSRAAPRAAQTLKVLAVTRSQDTAWNSVVWIEGDAQRSLILPENIDQTILPRTDGQRLYAYVRSPRGRRLAAFTSDGREVDTVSDHTPLVEPRGLEMTPDGRFLVFFLDDRTAERTELWAYNTVTRTKRVVVERLPRRTVFGPFFAADEGFLLVADGRVMAGSPQRTGVDLLVLPAAVPSPRWESGVVRSPDGTRIAVAVPAAGGARIVELPIGGGAPRERFATTRGAVRLLSWVTPDALVFTTTEAGSSGNDVSTLWVHHGDQLAPAELVQEAFNSFLLPDGRVGVVRQEAAGVAVARVDVHGFASEEVARLPVPGESGTPRLSRRPAVTVVQILDTTGSKEQASGEGSAAVAPDHAALLARVGAELRTLADVRLEEPVSVERVWVLRSPGYVYVDYRVGTTLWRRLLRAEQAASGSLRLTMVGVFAPANGQWVLARGADAPDPEPTRLYEFEPELNRWIEKPVGQGARP